MGHPDPALTFVVICGASSWPRLDGFPSSRAFANSAMRLNRYVLSPNGLRVPRENLLWLFDSDDDAIAQVDRIADFLDRGLRAVGASKGAGVTIFLTYVGHGAFFGTDQAYCLLLRDTHEPDRASTSLRVSTLAHVLSACAPQSSRIVVLDSCFAGTALQYFQSNVQQLENRKVEDALDAPDRRGVALLCAASSRSPARLAGHGEFTLFSDALLSVLEVGDPLSPAHLTLESACELTRNRLLEIPDAPRPEVHAPDQRAVDLTKQPLFPNPSFRPMGPEVPGPGTAPDRAGTSSGLVGAAPPALRRFTRRQLLISGIVAVPLTTAGAIAGVAAARSHSTSMNSMSFRFDRQLFGHSKNVRSVAFHPKQPLLASGGDDGIVMLWNLNDNSPHPIPIQQLPGHSMRVNSIAFNSGGTLLAAGGDDGKVLLWKLNTSELFDSPKEFLHDSKVFSVAFHPTLPLLAGGDQENVYLWRNLYADTSIRSVLPERPPALAKSIAFSSDGTLLAAGGNDKKVWLWELGVNPPYTTPISSHLDHDGGVTSVAFNSDGTKLASSVVYETKVYLWNKVDGKYADNVLDGFAANVSSVAFHPTLPLLASGSTTGSVVLWDLHGTTSPVLSRDLHTSTVNSVAFSSDGTLMATGSFDSTIVVWRQGK